MGEKYPDEDRPPRPQVLARRRSVLLEAFVSTRGFELEAPSQLALALKDAEMIRDERRRVDERATPRRDYQTFGDEIHAVMERRSEENPFARDDDRLEDALGAYHLPSAAWSDDDDEAAASAVGFSEGVQCDLSLYEYDGSGAAALERRTVKQSLEGWQQKRGGLARARHRGAAHIAARERERDRARLHRSRLDEPERLDGAE